MPAQGLLVLALVPVLAQVRQQVPLLHQQLVVQVQEQQQQQGKGVGLQHHRLLCQ